MMSEELLIDAAGLHGLLIDLAESAGTEVTWPLLNGVLIHTDTAATGERVLVGTSTDRFLLGQAHAPVTGSLPETFVPLRGVRVLIAALQAGWHGYDQDEVGDPLPRHTPGPPAGLVRLIRNDDALAVTAAGVSVRVALGAVEVPAWACYLPRLAAESIGTTAWVSPPLWQTLGRIADRRKTGIAVTVQAPAQPVRVHIGSQYQALVMPLQPQSVPSTPQLFLPRSASPAAKQTQRRR
jgi:hypothetical protein